MSFPRFPGRKMNRIDKPNLSVKLLFDITTLLTRLKYMFKGKKTYITGGLAILTAIGAYLTGDAEVMETVQLVVAGILAMTVRNALPDK